MIAISRYAKWLEEEKRRETWEETVNRYFNFLSEELKSQHNYEIPEDERNELEQAVVDLEVLPSMRGLRSAGPASKRDNTLLYNCSFLSVDSPRAFDETLYLLFSGVGVGFSVERQHVNQLPKINEHFEDSDTIIVVEDSKSGWAKALKELISLLISGQVPKWDLSKVRAAGSRLKTFGGRASGPEAWISVAEYFVKTFKKASGRKLTSLECHDLMCKIGTVAVVGGSRRAALISLSNLSDDRMRECKSGQWWLDNPQRSLANNSAVYSEKPELLSFMKEWTSLYQSRSGERGIFNRNAANKQIEKTERRNPIADAGSNPCAEILLRPNQFCVAGNTPLITRNSLINIADKENEEVEVWNGKNWSKVLIRKTREKAELLRVRFSDGSFLDCTPDHKFSVGTSCMKKKPWKKIEAKDLTNWRKAPVRLEPYDKILKEGGLSIKSAYTIGFAVGDGCVYRNQVIIDLYGEKDFKCPVEGTRSKEVLKPGYNVPCIRLIAPISGDLVTELKRDLRQISTWDYTSIMSFFAGLADSDGSETGTGGIRIYLSEEQRARDFQLILSSCGIESSVNLCQRAGSVTNFSVRKKDLWYLQITNCKEIPCHRLNTSKGHSCKFKGKFQTIKSIEKIENADVYCFTEHGRNMAVFGNVLTYQCNLSSVIVREEDNLADLQRKVRQATIIGTYQSALTNFKYLRKIWKNNCDEERLLGVSLSGILSKWKTPDEINRDLGYLKNLSIATNLRYANLVGIPQSKSITCVKPDGNTSQLVNGPSGIHAEWSEYYIRTVRGSNKDPLTKLMITEGIPYEADLSAPYDAVVFSFPRKAPEGSVLRKDLSAVEHLEIWKAVKESWCEHNPSITVNVKEDEWLTVADWVWKNFDTICGVSFLPYDDHTYLQAPYQEITKEKYEELSAVMPVINWDRLSEFEQEDLTTSSQQYACTGDSCSIVEV